MYVVKQTTVFGYNIWNVKRNTVNTGPVVETQSATGECLHLNPLLYSFQRGEESND